MSISRRSFLRDAGVAAMATAGVLGATDWLVGGDLGGTPAWAAKGKITPRLLDRVGTMWRETFEACVGTSFHVRPSGQPRQTLTLEAVRASAIPDPAQDCFSLRFRGAVGTASLEQGTYVMQNRTLGRFALFVVPMSDDGSGPTYEAVISRLVG